MRGISQIRAQNTETTADLVKRIRLQLIGKNAVVLPDTFTLSKCLGVSRMRLLIALHCLRDEGLISFRRGSKIMVADRKTPSQERVASPDTAERIFRLLEERIRTGRYRAGQQLPKRIVLAIENKVSSRAITEACSRLLAGGLVHRSGKRIVIGPPPLDRIALSRNPRYIIIIEEKSDFWPNICRARRTSAFGRTFNEEAGRNGIRLRLHTVQKRPGTRYFEYTKESFSHLPNDRSGSILGYLFAFTASGLETVADFILKLQRQRCRAVWFDRSGEGLPPVLWKAGLIRCHFSEKAAAKIAVEYLQQLGHREVAYVMHSRAEWAFRRLRLLRKFALELDPALTIRESLVHNDTQWQAPNLNMTVEKLKCLEARGPDNVKSALGFLICNRDKMLEIIGDAPPLSEPSPFDGIITFSRLATPGHRSAFGWIWSHFQIVWSALSCFDLLTAPSITAVIAPNDTEARSIIMPDLRAIGFTIPQDISVISFDNAFEALPLTTVDFGFGDLGYQAYHAIVNDLPTNIMRNDIAARPFVVDRETVLPASGKKQTKSRPGCGNRS